MPPKGGRQAILRRLPPTDGKSQEEAAEVVGVDQSIVSDWEEGISIMDSHNTYTPLDLRIWERDISDGNFTNTYTPLDLCIKVAKEVDKIASHLLRQ